MVSNNRSSTLRATIRTVLVLTFFEISMDEPTGCNRLGFLVEKSTPIPNKLIVARRYSEYYGRFTGLESLKILDNPELPGYIVPIFLSDSRKYNSHKRRN